MAKALKGVINLDITKSTPDWGPYAQPVAEEGAPNILYIVLDDVGLSAMEPFGGLIETPNINKIADNGLTYTNFHTTALCSPTRSCLLTGRNHTTNSMASITEAAAGFPNSSGHIPFECGNVAEVLGERGWNTYTVGKWHLCPEDEMSLASTRRQWSVGRGFERFYGFLGAETNQWYPDLAHDNHPVEQPKTPEEGYHESARPLSAKAASKTQPGKFSIAGEGLNIGKDSAEPVTDDYAGTSPWPFIGGTIEQAAVDVSGELFIDLAQEAAIAFARD
jgi:hypothetical protein